MGVPQVEGVRAPGIADLPALGQARHRPLTRVEPGQALKDLAADRQ